MALLPDPKYHPGRFGRPLPADATAFFYPRMMRRYLPLALAGPILGVLVLGSVLRLSPLPRLGPFLDPANGVWAVAGSAVSPRQLRVALPGLARPAEVLVDDRGVPHIFAATEEDAYRVMGYVVARDRLFQIELQTRATAGTLSEILGSRTLGADRSSRALGLADAADRKFATLDSTSIGYRAMLAYADGVNAWIDQMEPRDLPLEYRLLGVRPGRWEPKYTVYLFGRMGQTLASLDPAIDRLRVQALVGAAAAEALVPTNSPIQEPIQPNGQSSPRFDFRPLPPPGPPDTAAARMLALREAVSAEPGPLEVGALGSNNWAVAPGRTRAGHALLAGDPHLQLTLPSIWYEIHINVPGQLDVAGVSLPGAPGVVIGFNRDLAWTFTNTGGDVTDLYAEEVDDPSAPTRYRLDGAWRPLRQKIETYRGPGGEVLATDTIRFDHRGPLRRVDGRWFSTRWTVLEPGAENDVFLHLARSETVHEWLSLMEEYNAPTQNGLVADRAGTVAIRSSGWYPIRPGDGRGDRIFDGASSASDWTGRLPVSQYPFGIDPAQGYLASANQQPVDPRTNPAYLGADWPSPFRAIRINTLLRADSQMTADGMRRMQTDPGSARADLFVPQFLASAEAVLAGGRGSDSLRQAAELLGEWDRQYQPDNERAILFELAMREVSRRLFDELIPPGDSGAVARPLPVASPIVLGLMRDPASIWWDDRRTPERESRDDILAASLRAAFDSAVVSYGPVGNGRWKWGDAWPTDIWHLLRMPSLSALNLPVRGGPETIAPAGRHGSHGPSWRMVVELGDEVQAMGTYPGGQSGNPASEHYQDRVMGWTRGELDTLLFPRTPSGLPPERVRSRFAFVPGAR